MTTATTTQPKLRIGRFELDSPVVLAPMAGVTNVAFRTLCRELEIARLLKAIKDHGVKNVVFLTGDVHYCAAHHYTPENAAFQDFHEFWEFVAGPINAGSFGPNTLDGTFGPRLDFEAHGPVMGSPRSGEHQYFGHVEIPEDGREFRVRLINAVGRTVYSRTLTAA